MTIPLGWLPVNWPPHVDGTPVLLKDATGEMQLGVWWTVEGKHLSERRGWRDTRGRILQGFEATHYIMCETLLAIGDLPDADLYTAEMPDWLGEG